MEKMLCSAKVWGPQKDENKTFLIELLRSYKAYFQCPFYELEEGRREKGLF